MRIRYEIILLTLLAMSTSIGASAQKPMEGPMKVKKATPLRVPKRVWLSLSAATFAAAAFDMRVTADAVERKKKYPWFYLGSPEANPIARPFVNLPRPAYYACGFALATGINWLGYRMSRSPKWRKVWWLPQSISISANGYGYKSQRIN